MEKKEKALRLIGFGSAAIACGAAYGAHVKRVAELVDGSYQTALVTGATSGIGREFAIVFAEHHFNLVLIARNAEKLESLKQELEDRYQIKVTVIAKDLSDENAAREIYDEVLEKKIVVNQLVNNAGAGKQDSVTDADTDLMKSLIHLNITSVTMLCNLFGHDMAERGNGRILNVSSMGAFIPDPYFNVYGPTKAYELFLTEAMYGELHETGVTVSVLCPGPTKTNWASNAGKADAKIAKDPREVAVKGFEGMQSGQLIIIPNTDYKALRCIMRKMPTKLQVRIIARWQYALIEARDAEGASSK